MALCLATWLACACLACQCQPNPLTRSTGPAGPWLGGRESAAHDETLSAPAGERKHIAHSRQTHYTRRDRRPFHDCCTGENAAQLVCPTMAAVLPYRDINVHSSPSHYAFSSPSSPTAPTLVIDRPSGDIRLHDGKLLGSKRVSSVAGILGIIKLRLGNHHMSSI